MRHPVVFSYIVVIASYAALAGSVESGRNARIRLLFAEIEAGTMQSQHYCGLVFEDRRFHYEQASRHNGRDINRKIYEGELSEADWKALTGILDSKEFQAINVPRTVPSLVIQDSHSYTISVARKNKFQNMEFLDAADRRPYQSQLKPLLRWWKAFRKNHMAESKASLDARCSADNTHAVYNQ